MGKIIILKLGSLVAVFILSVFPISVVDVSWLRLVWFDLRSSQDDGSTLNANKDPLTFDGMADAEVERRLKVTHVILAFLNIWLINMLLN